MDIVGGDTGAGKRRNPIFVAQQEHGLPYSKGMTASSLMATGLGPGRSYAVANKVEEELRALKTDTVTSEELQEMTLQILRREAGDRYAEAFIKWHSVAALDIPLIILIGGATGVGKSTIATQLATRLGITRVVSTDAVREVLRSAFTREMFPTLYSSSFEADMAVRQPIPHSGDRLIIGFREQAAAVAVGAQALIQRAITEGTDIILEGAHLVPGFLQQVESDKAVIVPLLVTIDDEDLHRSHFYYRTRDSRNRPGDRYLAAFKKIRRIQKYMISSSMVRGVPIIPHYDLDATLTQIIDHVLTKTFETAGRGVDVGGGDDTLLEKAVEVMDKTRAEGEANAAGNGSDKQHEGSTREAVS
ncbi:MAG TPA: ATP cone domain-containing protein [Actinomycetota bacterium]|nr:ATP cone domain-containing protein [Actinomycetota bacterium]